MRFRRGSAASLAAWAFLTSTGLAADLVFDGGGERMAVPGERLGGVAVTRDHAGGGYAVEFRLGQEDAVAFHALTRKLIGEPLSVIVCSEELIRPVVREPIAGGAGIITMDSFTDAALLTARLKGEAPCPVPGGS